MDFADAVPIVARLAVRLLSRPDELSRPEQPVLEDAFNGWIDQLRKEAARRAELAPLWAHLAKGFHAGGLTEQARERFQQSMRSFQSCEAEEVDARPATFTSSWKKTRWCWYSLRGGKFALDVAAVAGSVAAGGIGWQDFIIAPLVASLTHQLVELLGWQVVDAQREQTAAPPPTGTAQATVIGADGGVADVLAGHRRFQKKAPATGAGPHPHGGATTRRPRPVLEELGGWG